MSAFSPAQMFTLDLACKPIVEAFCQAPYLVGTANGRDGYRDVDVRLMLPDKDYARFEKAVGHDGVTFLALAVSAYLKSMTGLPVDFQFQQQTLANERHPGMRNPLGVRSLADFEGDARPEVTQ